MRYGMLSVKKRSSWVQVGCKFRLGGGPNPCVMRGLRRGVWIMRGSTVHTNITPSIVRTHLLSSHTILAGECKTIKFLTDFGRVYRRLISAARCRDHLTVSVSIKQVLKQRNSVSKLLRIIQDANLVLHLRRCCDAHWNLGRLHSSGYHVIFR